MKPNANGHETGNGTAPVEFAPNPHPLDVYSRLSDPGAVNFYAKAPLPVSVVTKLAKAKAAMGPLIKNAQNPHLKNWYPNLEAVYDVIDVPLAEAGLVVYQDAYARYEGSQYVVVVRSYLIDADSGDYLLGELPMPVSKVDAQGVGSAITYGRRYLLTAQCGLAPEDDDGNHASGQQRAAKADTRQAAAKNSAKPEVNFDQADADQVKQIEKLAHQLYGDQAAAKLAGICQGASSKRTGGQKVSEPAKLSAKEAQVIIDGLAKRLAEEKRDDSDHHIERGWRIPLHAQEWAVQEGLVANKKIAQELWKQVVNDHFGGNVTAEDLPAAFNRYEELVQAED